MPVVKRFSKLWRPAVPNRELTTREFTLSSDNLQPFIKKYDEVQDKLSNIAAVDDLLAGKSPQCTCRNGMVCLMIIDKMFHMHWCLQAVYV